MRLYSVTVTFVLRTFTSASTGSLTIRRFANSASSAISTVSSLYGALSNFAWSDGANAGLKSLEVTEVTAEEIPSV